MAQPGNESPTFSIIGERSTTGPLSAILLSLGHLRALPSDIVIKSDITVVLANTSTVLFIIFLKTKQGGMHRFSI